MKKIHGISAYGKKLCRIRIHRITAPGLAACLLFMAVGLAACQSAASGTGEQKESSADVRGQGGTGQKDRENGAPEGENVQEAEATGRPVITSNIPGCRESVENGKSGLLVEAKNKEMLYQAMKKMLHCSREEREKMGKAGREKMKREFRKEAVVDRTVRSLE